MEMPHAMKLSKASGGKVLGLDGCSKRKRCALAGKQEGVVVKMILT